MARTLKRCPLCGSGARMGELDVRTSGKAYYAALCENGRCRLSEMPSVRLCHETPEWAADAWNGGAR